MTHHVAVECVKIKSDFINNFSVFRDLKIQELHHIDMAGPMSDSPPPRNGGTDIWCEDISYWM